MDHCIFSTCLGYGPENVENFIVSCRRVFSGAIHVITGTIPDGTIELFNRFGINIYHCNEEFSKYHNVFEARYPILEHVIEKHNLVFQKALICDIRDVIFQADPFEFDRRSFNLKFFLEDRLIKDCEVNVGWILDCYGPDVVQALGHNPIACSGTTMGSFIGVRDYLAKMRREIERTRPGNDQPRHNFLIHSGAFPDAVLTENRLGEVQTLHHQETLTFSRAGHLLNNDNRLCPVIHQYDRHPRFLQVFAAATGLRAPPLETEKAGRPRVAQVTETNAYNIVQAGERFLAVAKCLGPLSLFNERLGERTLGTLVMCAASLEEAKACALQSEIAAAVPDVSLVAETNAYNIVKAGERFLAVAKCLGPLSLFHERLGERTLGTLVMCAESAEDAKACALQGESAAAIPIVSLVAETNAHNIAHVGERFLALAKSLGQFISRAAG